jgi:GAF domain-containing protein/HAMP domain-containing protein
MISTILTSLHTFSALVLIIMAVLLILSNPRLRQTRAAALVILILSLSNIAFGLQFNSYSLAQVTPWILIEFIVSSSIGPAVLLVVFILLRPETSRRLYLAIALWIGILLPPFLLLLDLSNASQQIFTRNTVLDLERVTQVYTGGYIPLSDATTPGGNGFVIAMLSIFYLIALLTCIIVILQDRRTDKANQRDATYLLAGIGITILVSLLLLEVLPITTGILIANFIMAASLFTVALRKSLSLKDRRGAWMEGILEDYPVFTKITSVIALVVVPAILFLSFSTFSFFQTSLIASAEDNLNKLTIREAYRVSAQLEELVLDIEALEDANRVPALLANRIEEYEGFNRDQAQSRLQQFDGRWVAGDNLLISVTLDPVSNVELRGLMRENPALLRVVLTDVFGGLVTATSNPGAYNFGQTEWYLAIEQTQQPYLGTIIWDEPASAYTMVIAVPLFDESGAFSGVLQATYAISPLVASLDIESSDQIGFGIATSTGEFIQPSGNQVDTLPFPLPAFTTPNPIQDWRTFEINEVSSLVLTSPVQSTAGRFLAPWQVAVVQPVEQAITPLAFARTTTLVIAAVITLLSVVMVFLLSRSIVRPLDRLRQAAEKLRSGETSALVEISSKDELGLLSETFNTMASEMDHLVHGLENTIDIRTRDLEKRASQLEASAVIAREAAEVQDLNDLLNLVVGLVPDKFNYQHCGIFLVDAQRKFAVLQAANSAGGQRMLERGHKLQVGRVGVVGYCAGTGQPRIAQDVGADVVYYNNPDMPNTRSEMALPLIVRDQTIGVLDIQSDLPNAFQQEDIEILQVLADQLALAIDNTRLLESSQKALKELQTLYGQEAARSWQNKLTGEQLAYAYDSTGRTRPADQALPKKLHEESNLLSKPIAFRGQVIGNLDFVRDQAEGRWTDEEAELIEEILEQTALALENARLVQQIRLRSDQIRLLQEITALAASIMNEQELLAAVTEKLQTSLQIRHSGAMMKDLETNNFRLVASANSAGLELPAGIEIDPDEDSVTSLVIETGANVVIPQILGDPAYQFFTQNFTSRDKGSLILLPLIIREEVTGFLFLEDAQEDRLLDEEENDLFNQIRAQVANAIESARLFSAEQEARIASAALLEITQIASASLDINRVLNQATNRSARAIQAHRCTILLLDEKEKIKPLVSIFASGETMADQAWADLQTSIRKTYQDTPLRNLAANLREPRIIENPSTFQQLPLDWAIEMNINSMLMVPLISQNKVIGTMVYDQIDPRYRFRRSQEDLAQTIAGQIATTIENANLFEQAITRAERERQVTEITAKLRASNDPDEIMETALAELKSALAQSTIKARQAAQQQSPPRSNGNEDSPES